MLFKESMLSNLVLQIHNQKIENTSLSMILFKYNFNFFFIPFKLSCIIK